MHLSNHVTVMHKIMQIWMGYTAEDHITLGFTPVSQQQETEDTVDTDTNKMRQ